MNESYIKTLFDECLNIIEERGNQYSKTDKIFNITASLWDYYLHANKKSEFFNNINLNSKDVKMMMVLHKLAREMNKHKKDNIIDAINYLALYQKEIVNEQPISS